MGRYYFHVRRGRATILDKEGVELAGAEEASKEAARRALEIEAQEDGYGAIVVDDEFRRVLEVPIDGPRIVTD